MKKSKQNSIDRRSLLKWSTPVIAAVALPSHAETSPKTLSKADIRHHNIDYDDIA